jgi:ferredoxin-type protein NapH
MERNIRTGRRLMGLSVVTRVMVLVMLCTFAMWTEYSNLKLGYNNPRLVELASGPVVRTFYEASDGFLGLFGDPAEVVRRNGGMTWSVRVMGVPFTDPMAALSLLAKDHRLPLGFAAGLVLPLGLALVFGRVFCSYICPASLMFFAINRFRRLASRYFYFPEGPSPRPVAWGVLAGGLVMAVLYGHGVWVFILPYFAIGQTIFGAVAFGVLSVAAGSLVFFALVDLAMGDSYTCRTFCPTGRLLGLLGRKAPVSVRRDAPRCLDGCNACTSICHLRVSPRLDETRDCSLCGECLVACPTACLSVGKAQ